ncbi:hypothetical protein G8759_29135 [Spirosoma aureum]|uniref:Uncharacterized protein n=1 Tax=Spirosoma aureum TaxID=2692134 RepID=A0A6G9AVR0_9BACT|nr:hypothetical protein [Spirosoma aureum]QIP16419.1 hypothetical protein G8759_29135 [Spirosoma aureum]
MSSTLQPRLASKRPRWLSDAVPIRMTQNNLMMYFPRLSQNPVPLLLVMHKKTVAQGFAKVLIFIDPFIKSDF